MHKSFVGNCLKINYHSNCLIKTCNKAGLCCVLFFKESSAIITAQGMLLEINEEDYLHNSGSRGCCHGIATHVVQNGKDEGCRREI